METIGVFLVVGILVALVVFVMRDENKTQPSESKQIPSSSTKENQSSEIKPVQPNNTKPSPPVETRQIQSVDAKSSQPIETKPIQSPDIKTNSSVETKQIQIQSVVADTKEFQPADTNKNIEELNQNKSKKIDYKKQLDLARNNTKGWIKLELLDDTEKVASKAIYGVRKKLKRTGDFLVFSQVSMGEFLKHPNGEVFYPLANSKRVDFLITDMNYMPLAVIEINGKGHCKSEGDVLRNEVKKIITESANIEYIAIELNTCDESVILQKTSSVMEDFFNRH